MFFFSFLDLLFLTYFSVVTREKTHKILQHISHIHIRILLTLLTFFFVLQSLQNYEFIMYGFFLVWFLVLILFRATLEQSIQNGEQNLGWNVYYWYLFTLMQIKIYSHLWMTVDESSVQYRKRKKELLLSSSHFVFIGKTITTWWSPWVVWKLFYLM